MKTLSGFSRSVSFDESASRFGFLTRSTLLSAIHNGCSRCIETGDDALDLAVEAIGGIDDQQDEVGVAGAAPGRRDHRPVEPAAWLEDAGRVDQQDLRAVLDRDAHAAGRASSAPWG